VATDHGSEGEVEMGTEPGRLMEMAEEMASRAREEDAGSAALAVLAAHAVLEAMVNDLGAEIIGSFNYRARFLPKWHDLCERTIGRPLEAAPDLERLQALRDAVVGYRGDPERLDRRSTSPPPEAPDAVGAEEARWAVESARGVIAEFHQATGRQAPDWV
jgi:hypothetical protein